MSLTDNRGTLVYFAAYFIAIILGRQKILFFIAFTGVTHGVCSWEWEKM